MIQSRFYATAYLWAVEGLKKGIEGDLKNVIQSYANQDWDQYQRTALKSYRKIDFKKYRIDIPKSLCEAYAHNTTQRIRSMIENELDCIIESFNSKNANSKSKVSEATNYLELKPNFFGLGLNFNAIIAKLFKRKKI